MHDVIPLERQVEDLTKLVGLLFRKVALLQEELKDVDRARIVDAQTRDEPMRKFDWDALLARPRAPM
jgi:hypothetical protein